MDFKTLSDGTVINNLKCTICLNYLSNFPIFLTTNHQNICGRCNIPKESTFVRNEVYELIATDMRFPCRYSSQGCTKKLFPGEMSKHEKECKLRSMKCPAKEFNQCNDDTPLLDLKQHCERNHADILLKNGEFEVDLSTSEEKSYFIIYNKELYTFKKNFESKKLKFSCIVHLIEGENAPYPISYKLCLTTELRSLTIKGFVNTKKSMNEINETYLDALKIKNCKSVHGKITFGPHNDNGNIKSVSRCTVSRQLLSVLKCSTCSRSIMPPIEVFIQDNQISLYCSSCGPFHFNFIPLTCFNKIAEELEYPCENHKHGCDFNSKHLSLKKHHIVCQYAHRTCPLDSYENCGWKGIAKDVVSHITQIHSVNMVSPLEISEDLTWRNFAHRKCYMIKFSNNFFQLCFSAQNLCFFWTVQMIGEFQDTFLYEVEISNELKTRKLVTLQPVLPVTASTNCCFFNLEQIENITNMDENIRYKIRIARK